MGQRNKNLVVFNELAKAGLWGIDIQFSEHDGIDFSEVLKIAQEQSVVGLVAAGIDHVVDVKIPREIVLQFVGITMQLENRNHAMNRFIAWLLVKLRKEGIKACVVVKGQGVAQCYERPLWRMCGDVDLLLDDENYEKAKVYMSSFAEIEEEEVEYRKHIAYKIDQWTVELHGNFRCGFLKRVDYVLDNVHKDVFVRNHFRIWNDENVHIQLPAPTNDVVFVFTHILQHFFIEGIGLRQLCDWCRLIWKCYDEIDQKLLKHWINKMGLMTEWKTFAALVVEYLGMPKEKMPFYSEEKRWKKKAKDVMSFVMKTGNFGRNRDTSYARKYPYLVVKTISLWRHTKDSLCFIKIFPIDAIKFYSELLVQRTIVAINGK